MNRALAKGPLRLGVVGTGAMAAEMARAAQSIPGLTLAAVLSRDAARAADFCSTFAPGAEGCSDAGNLLGQVDAIYVATPPAHHCGIVEAAIEAGRPVLCEKPLTVSPEDTKRLLAKARDADVLVMEAIWTLALPAYRELKSSMGSRRNAVMQFDFSYPINALPSAHYFDADTGGVLIDRGVYGYGAAIALLGEVVAQSAFITRNSDGLDTSAELHLKHKEGARSILTLSFERVGPNLLHVSNESGLITVGPQSLAAETLERTPHPQDASPGSGPIKPGLKAKVKSLPLVRSLRTRLPSQSQFLSYGASSYAPILQEFVDSIAQGRLESEIVPHGLSEQIAVLTASARMQA